ncbi:MAG: CbiX/SirB N-terminal domain-containing protein [Verrucomicrobiota bacterium]
MRNPDTALVVVGHGSTLNADSSAPTFQHAAALRRQGLFAEVHECFWKEEPNFRQIWYQVESPNVYVVPNFISSGYFTEQIIPRELELDGPITRRDDRTIYYCDPVGLHPTMKDVLLDRARAVVANSGHTIADPAATACLFIVGHGTGFNDNSTKIIHQRAEEIRASGLYADCQGTLMEQKPFIAKWRKLTDCPDVVVVPFFISDGLHSFEDIPVLLDITKDVKADGFPVPYVQDGRRLWYATAVGTEASTSEVILAQVEKFNQDHQIDPSLTAERWSQAGACCGDL